MPKTKRPRELSIDPQRLAAAIEAAGKKLHMLTVPQVLKIAEDAGLVGEEFREAAYRLAAHEQVRRALRDKAGANEVPVFFNFTIEEKLPDGTKVRTQGYKHADALSKKEWDAVIEERVSAIHGDMVMCNRVVELRNQYAARKGWKQLPLPYPDAADGRPEDN